MNYQKLKRWARGGITREIVILTGILLLLGGLVVAQASRPHIKIEAESGSTSGQAASAFDSLASNGSYLNFASTPPTGTGRCQHTTTRICYNGQLWYTNGVNMPWIGWNNDFGGGGVVNNRTTISNRLAGFKNTGSTVVRWWMFEGGAWQINRDGSNRPTSLNNAIYADIDVALELAEQHDLYYNFTLFSGMSNGHMPSSWRTNTTHRQALADVLAPLFARYKDNPRVMSWEIWNEPEWDFRNGIDGTTAEQSTDIASRIITVIRREAPKAMTTVGQALVSDLHYWRNVDLDFDSPHWYDIHPEQPHNALLNTAAGLQATHGTNRPIVIGEYPHVGTTTQNTARLNDLYSRGYAGAWAWSLFHENTNDQIVVDLSAMTTFGSQHNDIGP
jgi:hypothetical protein